jgi:hypothetical protein
VSGIATLLSKKLHSWFPVRREDDILEALDVRNRHQWRPVRSVESWKARGTEIQVRLKISVL